MKKIVLFATVGLALFATAAFAHQYRGGHNGGHGGYGQFQPSNGWGAGCPMNTGMNGWGMRHGNRGMMHHKGMHQGMYNTTRPGTYSNWRANPAYQGQGTQETPAD